MKKVRRLVVSKFGKLSDELIKSWISMYIQQCSSHHMFWRKANSEYLFTVFYPIKKFCENSGFCEKMCWIALKSSGNKRDYKC